MGHAERGREGRLYGKFLSFPGTPWRGHICGDHLAAHSQAGQQPPVRASVRQGSWGRAGQLKDRQGCVSRAQRGGRGGGAAGMGGQSSRQAEPRAWDPRAGGASWPEIRPGWGDPAHPSPPPPSLLRPGTLRGAGRGPTKKARRPKQDRQ